MKEKNKVCIIFILALLFYPFLLRSQELLVKIEPAQVSVETGSVCSVHVAIENAVNLGSFQFDLIYQTGVVEAQGAEMGDFLGGTGRNVLQAGPEIDNTAPSGKVRFGGATFGTAAGPDGSGILAVVVFKGVAEGTTTLGLTRLLLSDIYGAEPENAGIQNGQIQVIPPAESGWGIRIEPRISDILLGESCTIDIVVENAVNMGSFQFDLEYNSDMVHAEQVNTGPFLSRTGRQVIPAGPDIDNSAPVGRVTFAAASYGIAAGPSGEGVLATVRFRAEGSGDAILELKNIILSDIHGQECACRTPSSAWIVVVPPSPFLTPQISGTSERLIRVEALSSSLVWAAGSNGTVLRTRDGGTTWQEVGGGLDSLNIYALAAADADLALAAGIFEDQMGEAGQLFHIYRTTDGGETWTGVLSLEQGFINDVILFNRDHGMAVGDPMEGQWTLFVTGDGGATWEQVTPAPQALEGEYGFTSAVAWLDSVHCWIGTNKGEYLSTADGWNSWSSTTIEGMNQISSISINEDGYGLAASSAQSMVARTLDNGATWAEVSIPDDGKPIAVLACGDFFWLLNHRSIYVSADRGDSWSWQATCPARLSDLSLVTTPAGTYGWFVGNRGKVLSYHYEETTHVDRGSAGAIPPHALLLQNYPNPFNANTAIQFGLQAGGEVVIDLYNLRGRRIRRLQDGPMKAGTHQVVWDGSDESGKPLPSGVYLYTLKTGGYFHIKKMIMVR